jgi:hypothetical protein
VYSITPAVRVDGRRSTLGARLAASRFESGRSSMQGEVDGAIRTAPRGAFQGEVSALAGALWYQGDTVTSSDLSLSARAYFSRRRSGLWLGAGGGGVALNGASAAVLTAGTGVWLLAGAARLAASASASRAGDVAYSEALADIRWAHRQVVLTGTAGVRGGNSWGGVRGWGELGASWWMKPHLAVVGSGGSYPADPSRGLPGGRYAALALRLSSRRRTAESPLARLARLYREAAPARHASAPAAAAPLELRDLSGGRHELRLRLPGARRVEIMGEFSDWQPLPLAAAAPDVWTVTLRLAPGIYRFNVRVDGGDWFVPSGVPSVEDDFSGRVGIIVVR